MVWPTCTVDGRRVVVGSDEGGDEAFALYGADLDSGAVERLTPPRLECEPPLLASGNPGVMVFVARAAGAAEVTVYTGSTEGPGRERARYRDAVGGSVTSVTTDARRAVFIRSKSHQSQEVVLVDLETGGATLLYPRHGAATVHDAAFSPDGRNVYIATDDGSEQGHVLAIDAATGGAMDVSSFTLNSFDGTQLPLVIVRPRGSSRPAPALVYLHGRPAGSSGFSWSPWVRQLIDEGYAVVAPNIRGSFGFGREFEASDDGPRRPEARRFVP